MASDEHDIAGADFGELQRKMDERADLPRARGLDAA
jgi:hypothetical protein